MICRREFITLLGGAAAWPVTVQAQQAAMPVIGLLHSGSPDLSLAAQGLAAFRRGLSENGFAEGRNVSIQYRWAEDHNERFPQLAAELVQRGVSGFVEGVEPGREGDALYVTIRSAKVTPSMGGGRMVEEVDEGESLRFLARWVRETFKVQPDDLRIMRVEGDSMEPTLLDQDTVIVDLTKKTPSPPGIFVLHDGMGLVAKRVEIVPRSDPLRLRIVSDNPRYAAYDVTVDEANIVGRIRWFCREL